MKKFNITYSRTIHEETTVTAKTAEEAQKKFKEVLPFDEVENIWEIKDGIVRCL